MRLWRLATVVAAVSLLGGCQRAPRAPSAPRSVANERIRCPFVMFTPDPSAAVSPQAAREARHAMARGALDVAVDDWERSGLQRGDPSILQPAARASFSLEAWDQAALWYGALAAVSPPGSARRATAVAYCAEALRRKAADPGPRQRASERRLRREGERLLAARHFARAVSVLEQAASIGRDPLAHADLAVAYWNSDRRVAARQAAARARFMSAEPRTGSRFFELLPPRAADPIADISASGDTLIAARADGRIDFWRLGPHPRWTSSELSPCATPRTDVDPRARGLLHATLVADGASVLTVCDGGNVDLERPGRVPLTLFSGDAVRLAVAAASKQGFVRLSDVGTIARTSSGGHVRSLRTQAQGDSMALSPDGSHAAWHEENGKLTVVDPATARVLWQHQLGPPSAALAFAGTRLVDITYAGRLQVLDAASGSTLASAPSGARGRMLWMSVSPKGTEVSAPTTCGEVVTCAIDKPASCRTLPAARATATGYTSDGALIIGRRDGTVALQGHVLRPHDLADRVTAVGAANGRIILGTDGDGIWQLDLGTPSPEPRQIARGTARILGLMPHGGAIVPVVSGDGNIRALPGTHLETPRRLDDRSVVATAPGAMAYAERSATCDCGVPASLQIRLERSGSAATTIAVPASVRSLALSADATRLAVLDCRGAVTLFDTRSKRELARHVFKGSTAVALDRKGDVLALADGASASLWRAANWTHVGGAPISNAARLAFATDSLLVSAQVDGTVELGRVGGADAARLAVSGDWGWFVALGGQADATAKARTHALAWVDGHAEGRAYPWYVVWDRVHVPGILAHIARAP